MNKYIGNELELFSVAKNWKKYWKSKCMPFLGSNVLDVGSGIGSNLALLWNIPSVWLCIEPDPILSGTIKRKIDSLGAQGYVKVLNCTLPDLPLAGSFFDTIIYIDVLEHIENDSVELEIASMYLNPGGHLIILSPAYQSLYSPFDKAVGHYRRYNRNTLISIGPANLRLVKCEYLDCIGLFASLVNKFFLKKDVPTDCQIIIWDRLMIPLSMIFDKLTFNLFGRSIYAVWKKK